MPWPKETFQSVAFPPRNDVNVEVRNGLANFVIDRHKAPLGVLGFFNGPGDLLDIQKKNGYQVRRKIRQRFVMAFGHKQAVACEQRPVIQERDGDFVLEYHIALDFLTDDLAEFAGNIR